MSGRMGYVYFACAKPPHEGGCVKIGFSADPKRRVKELSTGSSEPITLMLAIPGTRDDEQALHASFEHDRAHGEWFTPSDELVTFLRKLMHISWEMPSWRAMEPMPAERKRSAADTLEKYRVEFGENAELVEDLAAAFGDGSAAGIVKLYAQLAAYGYTAPYGNRMAYGLRAAMAQGVCKAAYVIACVDRGLQQGAVA